MHREAAVRRRVAAALNALVDRALERPTRERVRALLAAATPSGDLIERVRRRATLLARRQGARSVVARDRIVRVLYAAMLRPGWHVAWADASVLDKHASGIGGLVADGDGRVLIRVCQAVGRLPPFEAEIAAAAALAAAAARRGATHLRLYTDCRALLEALAPSTQRRAARGVARGFAAAGATGAAPPPAPAQPAGQPAGAHCGLARGGPATASQPRRRAGRWPGLRRRAHRGWGTAPATSRSHRRTPSAAVARARRTRASRAWARWVTAIAGFRPRRSSLQASAAAVPR